MIDVMVAQARANWKFGLALLFTYLLGFAIALAAASAQRGANSAELCLQPSQSATVYFDGTDAHLRWQGGIATVVRPQPVNQSDALKIFNNLTAVVK